MGVGEESRGDRPGPAAPLVELPAFALGASLTHLGLPCARRAAHRSPPPSGLREHRREDASGRLGKNSLHPLLLRLQLPSQYLYDACQILGTTRKALETETELSLRVA